MCCSELYFYLFLVNTLKMYDELIVLTLCHVLAGHICSYILLGCFFDDIIFIIKIQSCKILYIQRGGISIFLRVILVFKP